MRLSTVFGDDAGVAVRLLLLGAPRRSGVVDALFGRVVHYTSEAEADPKQDDQLPAPDVPARAVLVSTVGREALGIAIASDAGALHRTLGGSTTPSRSVKDYDDVACHFVSYRGLRNAPEGTIRAG